jgi:AcrR family transcriptional regulator
MPYPAKISRDAIVKLALRVIEREGSEALSMRAVARKLRVAPNALYNYFPNRRALEAAIAEEGYKALCSCLKRASSGKPGAAILQALCQSFLRFAHAHQSLISLMSRKHLLRREQTAIHRELMSLVIGKYRNRLQASKTTFAIFAMLHGIVIMEQNMRPDDRAAASSFATAALISGLTRSRSAKNTKPSR